MAFREDQIAESNERWRKALSGMAEKGDEVSQVPIVQMNKIILPSMWAEWTVRGDDLILHLFVNDGTYWRQESRSIVVRSMISEFRLENKEERMQISWEPELYSWCVIIKGIAAVTNPPPSMIERAVVKVKETGDAIQIGR
jgi:hypothetical protein